MFFMNFLFVHHLLASCFLVQSQASEQGRPPEHTSKFYAKGALQYLVPILTQTLTKQVAHLSEPEPVNGCFFCDSTCLSSSSSFCRMRTTTTTTGTRARRPACA